MGKYIHYFTAVTAYTDTRENNYEEPWVSLTEENSLFEVNYNKVNPKNIPLTFEILSVDNQNAEIFYSCYGTEGSFPVLEYNINGGEWQVFEPNPSYQEHEIYVNAGDIVQFRTQNLTDKKINFAIDDCNVKAKGNIMSLIYGENFANMTSFPENSSNNFQSLFQNCARLTDASELILPATTLTNGCYSYMFSECTRLTKAPVLPATTLAEYCYGNMFWSCTSLNYIKCLATDISATDSTADWVYTVAEVGTFIIQDGKEDMWKFGDYGIPSDWRVFNMSGEEVTNDIQEGEGGPE